MMMGRTSRQTRDQSIYPHLEGVDWQKKRIQGGDVRFENENSLPVTKCRPRNDKHAYTRKET